VKGLLPNKRLKLTAGFQRRRTFVRQQARTAARGACARRRSPRSLSAIR